MAQDPPGVPPSKPTTTTFSLGSKPRPPTRKPAPFAATKRASAALGSDSDSDDDASHRDKIQLVSGFDATRGGALDTAGKGKRDGDTGPLVIPALKNKDWRREAELLRNGGRKREIWVPNEARQAPLKAEDLVETTDGSEGQKYGLVLQAPAAEEPEPMDGAASAEKDADTDAKAESAAAAAPKTEDELALAALLNGEKKKSELVIASNGAGDSDWRTAAARETEEESAANAYKRDVALRPDMASLDDYAAVPVEEFGAALLRGMGWKEGQDIGRRKGTQVKPRILDKRPAFLGIGAKTLGQEIPELGSWGKGDKKKKNTRVNTTYVPVKLVDRKTGEAVDEAKLKQAQEKPDGSGSREVSRREDRGSDRDSGDRRRDDRRRDDRRTDDSRDGDRRGGSNRSYDDKYRSRDRSKDRERSSRDKDRRRDDDRGSHRRRERESHRDDNRRDKDSDRRRRSRDRESSRRDRR